MVCLSLRGSVDGLHTLLRTQEKGLSLSLGRKRGKVCVCVTDARDWNCLSFPQGMIGKVFVSQKVREITCDTEYILLCIRKVPLNYLSFQLMTISVFKTQNLDTNFIAGIVVSPLLTHKPLYTAFVLMSYYHTYLLQDLHFRKSC